ncbi:MAG TPA: ribosome biogenesis GTP-binding protein YihA/YsxC [Parachlamydiaceae bacterium]|nr:ribosome biogenesis GTP-binding protein YihA/YsxC [Parachlamydiaceae bacterium]
MTKYTFKNAKFITSATKASAYPVVKMPSGDLMTEIAVAGRSNVGKSSLLNHLFQSRDLVKTSSVPGKTQLINFFTLDEALSFVDLPGYGYAKVPMEVRKKWGPMIQEYLEKRSQLKLMLLLFDIRRIPNDEDRQLIEWIVAAEKSVILVLTKVDKVTRNEKAANTAKILRAFNCENLHYTHYSTTKNVGRKELISMLIDALADDKTEEETNEPD